MRLPYLSRTVLAPMRLCKWVTDKSRTNLPDAVRSARLG